MLKHKKDIQKALSSKSCRVRANAVRNCQDLNLLLPLIYDDYIFVLMEVAMRLPIEFVPLMLVVTNKICKPIESLLNKRLMNE